jgi:hypothetical protein
VVTATLGAPLVDVVGLERLELGRAEDVVEAVAEAVRIAHDRSRRA